MTEIFKWIEDNITAAIGMGTAIVSLLGILYRIGKFAKVERDKFLAIFELHAKIDAITAQLSTNGGSSLRDAIIRIEKRQCREAEKTRLIIEGGEHACFEFDENGKCIYVNQPYMQLIDRIDEKEVLGMNWRHLIYEDDREAVLESWDRAIKEARIFEEHFSYQDRKGNRIPVLCKAYPMYDYNQKVVGWFGISKKEDKNET